jgi:S-DNA-T family DNA segregation ATPase FtsK/SpoIIIE
MTRGLAVTTTIFHRPPRKRGPQPPRGELLLQSPPELTETLRGGLRSAVPYLAMLAGAGAMAMMFLGRARDPLTMATSALYAVSMIAMMAGQVGRGSIEKQQKTDGERRDYIRYLSRLRRQVRRAAEQQYLSQTWQNPSPSSLWSISMSPRLWERRTSDDDFLACRFGVSSQAFSVALTPPQSKPVEDLEPFCTRSLHRFLHTHSVVPDLPISMSLRHFPRVRLTGDDEAAHASARALLMQLATFHAPEDLLIAVCASPERLKSWDWVKWLPHAQHPTRTDASGPVRLFAGTLTTLESLLPAATARPRFDVVATALPHVVVVLDAPGALGSSSLADTHLDGFTVIDLTGETASDTATITLTVAPDLISRVSQDQLGDTVRETLGRPDLMDVTAAESLARLIAPIRTAGDSVSPDAMSANRGLPDLLRLDPAAGFDPASLWRPRPVRDRLRVPIGVGLSGEIVELDIKEASQDGMGPHGLLLGAIGSGKSELLRTLVLGLAMTNPPEALNFLLVDFKGGATFARLEALPHTSALITNLEDDLEMVDRMQVALSGELERRQEILRDAGNIDNFNDYERDREAGADLPPIPRLFIVVDEFSQLLEMKPEFLTQFVNIGRIGRSLGVHLLLASQRLEEGRLKGLDTHLSYRIGLRTFSTAESRAVLGVQDAAELPRAPGHGYLRTGSAAKLIRFRAAYVSGPLEGRSATYLGTGSTQRGLVPYRIDEVHPTQATTVLPPDATTATPHAPAGSTVLEMAVRGLVGHGTPAHQVWLPPLSEPPTLDQLLPALTVDPERGLGPANWPEPGGLRFPVGVVDVPFRQRRDPLWFDLSGSNGHVAVVGRPQSGKSTLVRDLMVSIALTHTAEEAQIYCLDLSGGSLSSLTGLPHVGSSAGRKDAELIRRTLAEISALLERRERLFTERGIESMAAYRKLRRSGSVDGDAYGDVFLVIDGWGVVRAEFEAVESTVTELAGRGLGYGIHVVLTAQRWSEIRLSLLSLIGTRAELRLGDPGESEVDRRVAKTVPDAAPGRGVTPEKLHFLSALPRIDGNSDIGSLSDGVRHTVERIAAAWPGPVAPDIRLLPTVLPASDLPRPSSDPHETASGRIPIGVEENALGTVDLDLAESPHFVVFGDGGCGKTNLLRLLVRQVATHYGPDAAQVVVIDYRRGLLDVAGDPHVLELGYTAARAEEMVLELVEGLRKRLPPPNLSAERLMARDWWSGRELFVVVDDYDLVATSGRNPLAPLLGLIPLSRDIGLHLIVARASGGAGRSLFEAVMQQLRDIGSPALIMSGSPDEGGLFGNVKPERLPAGRGRLVSRRQVQLIQTAHLPER